VLGHTEHVIRRGDRPVTQNGLVESRVVVEAGIDVVARLDHLPRCFGVKRLIGVPDRGVSKTNDVRQNGGRQEPDEEEMGAQKSYPTKPYISGLARA
jgi:hypothetical protein